MAGRVIITGGNIDGVDSTGRDANVDANGNLWVREGHYDFDNKTYEDTLTVDNSPVTVDFNDDTGRNAVEGWIINDGAGTLTVAVSRRGLVFGDAFTVKKGETVDFLRLDIDSLKLTHSGTDADYRIFLI